MLTPFHNKAGNIVFPWQATSDRVFIYPIPPEEVKYQGTIIFKPDISKGEERSGLGVLLSVGSGYWNSKGKFCPTNSDLVVGRVVAYDKTIPWTQSVQGADGEYYEIVFCGAGDVLGVALE